MKWAIYGIYIGEPILISKALQADTISDMSDLTTYLFWEYAETIEISQFLVALMHGFCLSGTHCLTQLCIVGLKCRHALSLYTLLCYKIF